MDADVPVPLGTATTDGTGTFSYTSPATASLPAAVAQAVDDNDGVLNVVADAMGRVDGTTYTTAAAFGASLGVGLSDGTMTTDAAEVRGTLAGQPREAKLLISDESSTAPDPTATSTGEATEFSTTTTADEQLQADTASTDWQAATSLSPGSYNPMYVGGTNYTYSAQSPVPDSSPSGQCQQGVEYEWVAGSTTTQYTTVGEAHAYYDATAGFWYTTRADSDISLGISYDGGNYWKVSGSGHAANTVSASSPGFGGMGPYWARKWREPFQYKTAKKMWRCEEGGSWHYWYTQVYSVAYHIPPGWAAGAYGEDVRFEDGSRQFHWAAPAQHAKVVPGGYFVLDRGRTSTYSFAASVFGFGPSVTSTYSDSRVQLLHAGKGKYEHDVFTDDPDINYARTFYSF